MTNKLLADEGIKTFPDECCGFLFGQEDGEGNRVVSKILPVDNAKQGDKKRRFEIAAFDYMKAEEWAVDNNLSLLGIYHSHPNHPPVPSEHDRKAAQPYFSYVIVSVVDAKSTTVRSWRLNDEEKFEEETIKDYQLSY